LRRIVSGLARYRLRPERRRRVKRKLKPRPNRYRGTAPPKHGRHHEKRQAASKKVGLEVVADLQAAEKSNQAEPKVLEKLTVRIGGYREEVVQLFGDAGPDTGWAGEILCDLKENQGEARPVVALAGRELTEGKSS
jgi:hypothetical protein